MSTIWNQFSPTHHAHGVMRGIGTKLLFPADATFNGLGMD